MRVRSIIWRILGFMGIGRLLIIITDIKIMNMLIERKIDHKAFYNLLKECQRDLMNTLKESK